MSAPLNLDAIFEDWPEPLAVRDQGRITARNAAARALGELPVVAPAGVRRAVPARLGGAAVELLFLEAPANGSAQDPLDLAARLIGGIAHDLNNTLMAVTTTTEVLAQSLEPQHPARSDVTQVLAATRRAVEHVRTVPGFARRHPGPALSVDLPNTLRRLGRMIGRIADREVVVEPDVDVAAAHVLVDPGVLDRLVARLTLLGAGAAPPGSRLALGARSAAAREGATEVIELVFRPLPSVAGALTGDTAGGLSERRVELPAEALTLATEAGITLRAEGPPDEVTTWILGLPRDRTRTTTLGAPQPTPAVPASNAAQPRPTILVVEDDATALGTVAMLLRREGYEVLTTTSPSSAMALFRARDARVDLLVTDVIMPTLDGDLLARQMLALAPQLPVLYMSGYPADILKGRLAATPGARFLPKPFTPTMLLAQVRRLLDDALSQR